MKKLLVLLFILACSTSIYAVAVDKSRLLFLLRQTEFYIIAENFERAAELRDQSMVMFKDLGAKNDVDTFNELHKVSHAYSEKKMSSEAVKTESLLVEFFPLAMPDNIIDYALFLSDLSLYLLEDDSIALAEYNIKKALALINSEIDEKLAVIYFRAAEIFIKTTPQRIDLSIAYQKKVVETYANAYGKNSSEYLDELRYLAKYYEKAEDYEKACNAYLEIMHTRADNENDSDLQSFLPVLDRIIICSRKINNSAMEKECKEIAFLIACQEQEFHQAKYPSIEFPSPKDSLDELAISNKMDSYQELLDQFDGDEVRTKQIKEEISDYLATLPDSYGKAYFLSFETLEKCWLLDWSSAIEYGVKALCIFDKLGVVNDKYVMVLDCVAQAYNGLDNHAKAYDYILRAYELRDDFLSFDHCCPLKIAKRSLK